MKLSILTLFLIFGINGYSQSAENKKVQIKLYIPAHLPNQIKSTDKLLVYISAFPDNETQEVYRKTIAAKKIKENIYEIQLPERFIYHLGFQIGVYGTWMNCINNRLGDAADRYFFDVTLEKKNFKFGKVEYTVPCIVPDEEIKSEN